MIPMCSLNSYPFVSYDKRQTREEARDESKVNKLLSAHHLSQPPTCTLAHVPHALRVLHSHPQSTTSTGALVGVVRPNHLLGPFSFAFYGGFQVLLSRPEPMWRDGGG